MPPSQLRKLQEDLRKVEALESTLSQTISTAGGQQPAGTRAGLGAAQHQQLDFKEAWLTAANQGLVANLRALFEQWRGPRHR